MLYLYYLYEDGIVKYVGITKNVKERKRDHKRRKPYHEFKVIHEFYNLDDATIAEKYHIELHNTYINGWNRTTGGEYKENSGYNRKGIGGVVKGNVPWNKGKKGYHIHNEDTIYTLSNINSGELNKNSKLNIDDVTSIINDYMKHNDIGIEGNIMKNGRMMSYNRAFSLIYSKKFGVTPENITRIIERKSWKKLWSILVNNV